MLVCSINYPVEVWWLQLMKCLGSFIRYHLLPVLTHRTAHHVKKVVGIEKTDKISSS